MSWRRSETALLAATSIVVALIVQHVNKFVPIAYMDEIFHVPQTQAYCHRRFNEWNNKITTLPGLYENRLAICLF